MTASSSPGARRSSAGRAWRSAARPTTTGSTSRPSDTLIDILRTILLAFAAIAVLVGGFTIFNSLRSPSRSGRRSSGCCGWSARPAARCARGVLAEATVHRAAGERRGHRRRRRAGGGPAGAVHRGRGWSCRREALTLATRTIVVSLARRARSRPCWPRAIPARRATKIAPVAALRDAAVDPRPGLFARGVRGLAGVVGRPAALVGGAAGGLARRNAMRNPGRTAVTASALMIGVALVTAVTVVATGLKDESSGALERRVQATAIVTAADGWSPIDPQIERTVGGSSVRQDGALVFGHQEGVNGVDPATIGRFYRYDFTAGGMDATGAVIDDGFASEHGLQRRQPADGDGDERQDAAPEGLRHREVPGARRARLRPDHDLPGGVRPDVRTAPQPAHVRGRRSSRRSGRRSPPSRTRRSRARTPSSTARRPGSG